MGGGEDGWQTGGSGERVEEEEQEGLAEEVERDEVGART